MPEKPAATKASDPVAVDAPPLAPETAKVPVCFVVDEEPSIRHFLSLVLHGSGVDTREFPGGVELRKAIETHAPDLIFLNIPLESADAIESVIALGKCGYRGPVQLMSNRGAAVLEHVKGIGAQRKLNLLPVLKKPFETEAIVAILRELKLGMPPTVATRIDLDEALANKWIEVWFQPKIDLRRKRLAGAEAYTRARHPQHGIVLPEAYLPGAPESSLTKLAELELTSALKAGRAFSTLGISLTVSVNIPLAVLGKMPVSDIVDVQHSNSDKWAGLIIDIPEEQIANDFALAADISKRLAPHNVRLALDDCGRSTAALARLSELPLAELKLDRTFVTDCGTDRINAPLCKTAINLAHNFGRAAVGTGIEKAADAVALVSMGCDFGQGFLFGQPMPEERFVALLRQRAGVQEHPAAG